MREAGERVIAQGQNPAQAMQAILAKFNAQTVQGVPVEHLPVLIQWFEAAGK